MLPTLPIDTDELTDKFRAWAARIGVTPAAFARKTGYPQRYVDRIFEGSANVTRTVIGRIITVYGLDAAMSLLENDSPEDE